jgi:hypothetical protein
MPCTSDLIARSPVNPSTELPPFDEKFELAGDLPGRQGPAASRSQTHPPPVEVGRSERLSQLRRLPTGRERHLDGAASGTVSSRKGRIAAATRSGFWMLIKWPASTTSNVTWRTIFVAASIILGVRYGSYFPASAKTGQATSGSSLSVSGRTSMRYAAAYPLGSAPSQRARALITDN